VVVENRVGGTGTLAGEAVAKSSPDGHTLLVGHDGLFVINPHLYKEMAIDPLKDLAPVASLVSNGFFLAINPSVPAQNFTEFIEYARRADPPLQYGSGGNGSQHHLTMERLKVRAGINMVHVPYKGGAPATTATVAGEVAAMMSAPRPRDRSVPGACAPSPSPGRSARACCPACPPSPSSTRTSSWCSGTGCSRRPGRPTP